jgi:predicted GIY-YIG superfamily endonuclease
MTQKQWCVYLLKCSDGSLYCGCTNDLNKRIEKHNAGTGAKYTKTRLPVELVYSEPAENKSAALKREYAIKQLSRQQKMELFKEPLYEDDPIADPFVEFTPLNKKP